MPLKLKQLDSDVRRLPEIKVGDGTLNIAYKRPSPKYIDEMTASVRDVSGNPTISDTISGQLLPLLRQWDFTDDDGKPMPIDQESLSLLPYELLLEVVRAILNAEKPSPNA